ncbi:MAG TPA: AmmeMemoRadiSam system protein B [Phycisphaerae bacterium]|nr:AmmeMemoRadiSam system protein B [Phycisphaerae bacterium]
MCRTRWFGLLATLLISFVAPVSFAGQVRRSTCAGTWYPAKAADLRRTIDGMLAEAKPPKVEGNPVALIVPHAGLRYSGKVGACAFKALGGRHYDRVIVLAISHRVGTWYRGASVPARYAAYETPLGQIPIDQEACQKLLSHSLFRDIAEADEGEHSLEIELPFLQRVLDDFKLVPVLMGSCEAQDYDPMARALLELLDDQTLLVASTDFTHYGPNYGYLPFTDSVERNLNELADAAVEPILACDFDGFRHHVAETQDSICGRHAVSLLLRVLQLRGGATGTLMGRDTSGHITGDFRNSVTYLAVALTPTTATQPAPSSVPASRPAARFSPAEHTTLLRLARAAATTYLSEGKRVDPRGGQYDLTEPMLEPGAAFVTLKHDGQLRGCIGHVIAVEPLVDSIVNNAISAATRDVRFADNPITLEEMGSIAVEVSVMSPLKRVNSTDEIVLGRDGVVLQVGQRQSLFLPQVADETGWSKEMFLSRLATKAGLPPGAWRRPDAVFHTFTAEVFGERHERAKANSDHQK